MTEIKRGQSARVHITISVIASTGGHTCARQSGVRVNSATQNKIVVVVDVVIVADASEFHIPSKCSQR